MDWEIILVYSAFLVYLLYNISVWCFFGLPFSLSQTFYLFQERNKYLRFLFPAMMVIIACCLLPSWLEISKNENLEFMAFLSVGGMLFTGFTPTFKNSDLEDKIHTYSAYLSSAFALLWIIFVTQLWYVIVLTFIFISLITYFTKTFKSSYVYCLETVVFISTFIAILCTYFK